MSDLVLFDPAAPVATVTLNQPDRRNPTSIAMLDAIDVALDACSGNDDVRVIVLAGAGRSFCSGLDLGEARGDDAVIHTLLRRLSEVMRRLRRLTVPVIAQVQGAAIGGGFGFMAASDFAITHPEAKVGYPPPDLGLSPALMAPWLVRKVGPSRARAMLLEGGTISGASAHAAGIASHLAERDELPEAVARLAATIAGAGRESTRRMKAFLNELDGSTDDETLDRAAVVSAEVIAHPETQARLAERFGPA